MLIEHFHSREGFELVLIDRDPGGNDDIHKADLRRYDAAWTERFAGADVVVHLAGKPGAKSPSAQYEIDNIEASLNVFRAAGEFGVRRVVYASSLQVMLGYRYTSQPIAADAPPRPVSFYGAAKLFCETMARHFAEEGKFSAICFRIGGVETGVKLPSSKTSAYNRAKWLAAKDLCQAFEKAILVEDVRFAILPLVSDNHAMPWDLSETRGTIGYAPTEGYPRHPIAIWIGIRGALGRAYRRHFDPNWRAYRD